MKMRLLGHGKSVPGIRPVVKHAKGGTPNGARGRGCIRLQVRLGIWSTCSGRFAYARKRVRPEAGPIRSEKAPTSFRLASDRNHIPPTADPPAKGVRRGATAGSAAAQSSWGAWLRAQDAIPPWFIQRK
jgi:hypothetical protein